jgi:tetratricopeptide (TPR) repeat protein
MRELSWMKNAILAGVVALSASYAATHPVFAAEPGDALALSFGHEAKGELQAALSASQQAADANPKLYFARLRVAYLELALKNYAAAERDYARAAELAPRSIEALLGRQQALIALGRYEDAEGAGRAVLARDPDNYLASSRLAWTFFSLKRFGEAAKLYTGVLSLYPGDLEMMLGLGYSQLRAGKKRDAAETFRVVLGINKNHPRAREGLAACR